MAWLQTADDAKTNQSPPLSFKQTFSELISENHRPAFLRAISESLLRIPFCLLTTPLADTTTRWRCSQPASQTTAKPAVSLPTSPSSRHLHHQAANTCTNSSNVTNPQTPPNQSPHQQLAPASANQHLHFQTYDRPVAHGNPDSILIPEQTNYRFQCYRFAK